MKTTPFIIAALLPLAAAAQGTGSTAVFGVLDLAATQQRKGGGQGALSSLDSGVGYGSRFGLRGSERLEGGLTAQFTLEMGLAPDTGALQQGGLAWGRQAWVGLAAGSWSLSAGRQYSPLWSSLVSSEAFSFTYWGNAQSTQMQSVSAASVAGDGGHGALSRINNSLLGQYSAGPWSARLMLAAGEPGRLLNPALTYQSGPWMATASAVRFRQFARDLPAGAAARSQVAWVAGVRWDAGFARWFAGHYAYNPSEDNVTVRATTTLAMRARWLGVQVPVGGDRLVAQLTLSRLQRMAGVTTGHARTLGIAWEHPLSKRSLAYASWGQVRNDATAALPLYGGTTSVVPAVAGADPQALSLGLRHSF